MSSSMCKLLGHALCVDFEDAKWKDMRKMIINAIIHTDMVHHFPMVSKVLSSSQATSHSPLHLPLTRRQGPWVHSADPACRIRAAQLRSLSSIILLLSLKVRRSANGGVHAHPFHGVPATHWQGAPA